MVTLSHTWDICDHKETCVQQTRRFLRKPSRVTAGQPSATSELPTEAGSPAIGMGRDPGTPAPGQHQRGQTPRAPGREPRALKVRIRAACASHAALGHACWRVAAPDAIPQSRLDGPARPGWARHAPGPRSHTQQCASSRKRAACGAGSARPPLKAPMQWEERTNPWERARTPVSPARGTGSPRGFRTRGFFSKPLGSHFSSVPMPERVLSRAVSSLSLGLAKSKMSNFLARILESSRREGELG